MKVNEAAKIWNLTERQITSLCKNGKITGAKKIGKYWHIPENAEKPQDRRIKTGKYIKRSEPLLNLPLGVSEYKEASQNYYYVDKTLLIKEIIDKGAKVTLFTRPRRFGKTLNMSMLKCFFEFSDEDNSIYFKDRKIWKEGKKYKDELGQYPVIYLTLKDVKKDNWDDTLCNFSSLIAEEYMRHDIANKLNHFDYEFYNRIVEEKATRNDLEISLARLSGMLYRTYKKKVVIIIDEYDTPIQQGHIHGFYDEVNLFVENLFSGAFKDNDFLKFGFLTGILRIAKENLFSGLNNLIVRSVLDDQYSSYFGFTSEEVHKMAAYYNSAGKMDEIRQWYDGYQFGNTKIFNPWSVLSYFFENCSAKPYWKWTASNEIISEILENIDYDMSNKLQELIEGKKISARIDTDTTYHKIKNDSRIIYGFLLFTGYLKYSDLLLNDRGEYYCNLSIPNKEIEGVFKQEVLEKTRGLLHANIIDEISIALETGNVEKLENLINDLLSSASYFDTPSESFYHGFMLAICSLLSSYYTFSNREAGQGRFDILMMPKALNLPGIVIEFKADKNATEEGVKTLSEKALKQIEENDYTSDLKRQEISQIFLYGVAFSAKNVAVSSSSL